MAESTVVEASAALDAALDVLSAVADPVRWRVLDVLAGEAQCVCRLQERIPIAPNLLSYHLKVLREAGLVTATRRGRWVDYALAEDAAVRMASALPGAGGPAAGCGTSATSCGR